MRKPRLDTRNGLYHVIAKGNDGRLLFRQPVDFSKFLHLLSDSRDKDPHVLLSYCLMPNHIHLLVETAEVPLSKILHRLLLRYSLYFNKRYERSGHLFQNRFKAKPCKQENYLLQLLVYIHDNPRKAGLVDGVVTYTYSSERIYQRKVAIRVPVNNMRALAMIGPSPKAAWRAYHHHLNYTRNREDEQLDVMRIRSDTEPSFHPDQEVYFDPKPLPESVPSANEFDFLTNVPLDQICKAVADVMDVPNHSIVGRSKHQCVSRARSVLIYVAGKAGWRPVDLMRKYDFNPATIAYHRRRYEIVFDPEEKERVVTELKRLLKGKAGGKDVKVKAHKEFDF